MIRRILSGSVLVAVATAAPAVGGDVDSYSLIYHMAAPSFSGCNDPAVADAALSCSAIDPDANDYSGQPNFMWVLVGAVPEGVGPGAPGGIGGVQFGIAYDFDVAPSGWTLCSGGSEIQQDNLEGTWPESGTGNAITFGGGCKLVTENSDGVTRVGFFNVTATTGTAWFVPDPRTGVAEAADCDTSPTILCKALYSSTADAVIDGGGGFSACGISCTNPTRTSTWGDLKGLYR